MSDFITLKCPSCGAALQATPGTLSLKCPSCGNEHMVRHEGGAVLLESYARCPKCGRNDQVKKVSGMTRSASSVDGTLERPLQNKPEELEPEPLNNAGVYFWLLLIFTILVFAVGLFKRSDFMVCGGVLVFPILYFGYKMSAINKIAKERKEKYEYDMKEYKANLPIYLNMQKRWENLYYCQRDDCIFVPGEGTWAPTDHMKDYLN